MRLGLLILIFIATLFGSGYWYSVFGVTCKIPLHYRIGTIDPRFGTEKDELARIVKNAEKIWESKINKDLFVYDEEKGLPIQLTFDDRQKNADLEAELREDLVAKEGMSESVAKQYQDLVGEFRTLKKRYESRVVSYEAKLAEYNNEVTEWNNKGGAPTPVIEKLSVTEKELTTEQKALEELLQKLNDLVVKLNAIGARGNSLVTDYNTIVNQYNERFSEAQEFTQGEYTHDAITVYQFDSESELTIVLAHELGHALSLGHVLNEKSIMYHFMGAQSEKITAEDVDEFNRVCSTASGIASVLEYLARTVRSFAL